MQNIHKSVHSTLQSNENKQIVHDFYYNKNTFYQNKKLTQRRLNTTSNSLDEKPKLIILFCYETTNPSFIVSNSNY